MQLATEIRCCETLPRHVMRTDAELLWYETCLCASCPGGASSGRTASTAAKELLLMAVPMPFLEVLSLELALSLAEAAADAMAKQGAPAH